MKPEVKGGGVIRKAYAYITREEELLVFRHVMQEAGIQVPKGTVEDFETTWQAVIREIKEETGLTEELMPRLIADDLWEADDGRVHHRFFYHLICKEAPDHWTHKPTGGGAEKKLTFHFYWMPLEETHQLVPGHADFVDWLQKGDRR
ncbi:NUDIX domain-containing protein [Halobacillus litoralis]|uniref:NUDIX hydrolase n=1 Tax=Halobacillus litoralis TaxID=45668 RepID=UPI001CD55246|nr:NUDIX domain-containing protein [Halobacillus litoralis]MCA0969217.1 NUDIX domain-containing protein [Halobacillus litoralis]